MNIKYLQDMHDAVTGEVKEVPDLQANVLIKLGVAEEVKPAKKPVKTEKQD